MLLGYSVLLILVLCKVLFCKTMYFLTTVHIFILLYVFTAVSSREGIHEKMYKDMDHKTVCFRRLNGTHQFGCSSFKGGNVGIIHIIKTNADLNMFLQNSTSENYILAVYMTMFTTKVVDQLIHLSNIAGLLLIIPGDSLPEYYSPDEVCPNSAMESCGDDMVNPYGNGFLFIDWPFPMFVVDDKETIDALGQCYEHFNIPLRDSQLSRPLCSLQMKSHMSAAVNTPTCLRRESEAGARLLKYCDPMGDRNVILPIGVFKEGLAPRSTIIIAARLDTASIFDGLSPGAITSATGIVTLLTTAKILSSLLKNYELDDKQVMFMLFNGEAQDYIGSSRTVYDMKNGDFKESTSLNLTLENIMAFIELTQINDNTTVYLHKTNDGTMRDFERKLIAASDTYSLHVLPSSLGRIPPSSLQIFTKADPLIPGVVISNYDKHYTNKYFNGMLDSIRTLNYSYGKNDPNSLQSNIASISSSVASAVFNTLTGTTKPVSREEFIPLIDDLLVCYLHSRFCKLMREVSSGSEANVGNSLPWPLYVSVKPSLNPITTATGLLLAYLTSDQIKVPEDKCVMDSKDYSYYWINGPNNSGICLNTTLKFTPAVSPAFLIPDYDWTSRMYSSWTESIWFDISMGMFLKPSRRQEWITFSVGLIVFFTSFILVYWLKSKEMFNSSRTCSLLTTNC